MSQKDLTPVCNGSIDSMTVKFLSSWKPKSKINPKCHLQNSIGSSQTVPRYIMFFVFSI